MLCREAAGWAAIWGGYSWLLTLNMDDIYIRDHPFKEIQINCSI
jgi:hypothetical protein